MNFVHFVYQKKLEWLARIVVSLQCHKHDMKASFEYTGYYPF